MQLGLKILRWCGRYLCRTCIYFIFRVAQGSWSVHIFCTRMSLTLARKHWIIMAMLGRQTRKEWRYQVSEDMFITMATWLNTSWPTSQQPCSLRDLSWRLFQTWMEHAVRSSSCYNRVYSQLLLVQFEFHKFVENYSKNSWTSRADVVWNQL